jgi:hypothetical protein
MQNTASERCRGQQPTATTGYLRTGHVWPTASFAAAQHFFCNRRFSGHAGVGAPERDYVPYLRVQPAA